MAAEEGKHERAREAKDFAERCFIHGDIAGANRWCQTAQRLAPDLPGVAQAAAAYNVHSVAARKPVGAGREALWYAVLDLAPPRSGVVTHDAIKKQYRKMCMLVHPDKNNSAAADGAFKLVQAAWTALSARHPPPGSTASAACPPRAEELHRHRTSAANKPRPDPPQTTPKQPSPPQKTPERPSPQKTPERPSPQKTPEQPSPSQTTPEQPSPQTTPNQPSPQMKYKRPSPQTKYKRPSPKPKPKPKTQTPPQQPQPTIPRKPQVVQMPRTAKQPDLRRMSPLPPPPMARRPSPTRGKCPYCGAQYIGTQCISKAFRCMSCHRSPMDNKQWNSDEEQQYYDDDDDDYDYEPW
ncbi:hypothetical protein ABZP36_018789 [Zizania latifolia]